MRAILRKDTITGFIVEKKILFFRLTAGVKKGKEKEGKRAKEQECKGLLSPPDRADNTKTNNVVVVVAVAVGARRGTAVLRIADPRTAPQHPSST